MFLLPFAFLLAAGVFAQTTTPSCAVASATPSPKATICGAEGSVNGNLALTVSPQYKVDDCRDLCLSNSNCKSYGYNATYLLCTEYSGTPKAQNFKPGKTNMRFWHRNCWKQDCKCDTTESSKAPNLCNRLCVNKNTDSDNCGKCGKKCPDGQDCLAGTCMPPPDRCTKTWTCKQPIKPYLCGPKYDRGGSPCVCYDEVGKKDSGYCVSDVETAYGRGCRTSFDCDNHEFCSYNSCYGGQVCIARYFDCNNPAAPSRLFREV